MTASPDEPLPDENATEDPAVPAKEPVPPMTTNPLPTPTQPAPDAEVESRLRAELAELLAIGAQAQRLGVAVDAADAMARGFRPEALRRAVTLEVRRSEVASPAVGDSFEVAGERLLVQGEPLADAERLVWTIEARPA